MKAMQNITPISSKVAILHKHGLAFSIPGIFLVYPLWMSVEPVAINNESDTGGSTHLVVHIVLYQLSELCPSQSLISS